MDVRFDAIGVAMRSQTQFPCYDSCMSEPLTLKEVIRRLEREKLDHKVAYGFGNPHSYRGYYDRLCFEPVLDTTVRDMLEAAQSSVGKVFTGWKGGDYVMTLYTDCHLNRRGHCMDGEDELTKEVLEMMLSTIAVPSYLTELYRETVIETRKEDVVLAVRRPDYPTSYVFEGEDSRIKIIDLDLGSSFDETRLSPDDREAVEELATSVLKQLNDNGLDEWSEVRHEAEDILAGLLERVGSSLDDIRSGLDGEPQADLSL